MIQNYKNTTIDVEDGVPYVRVHFHGGGHMRLPPTALQNLINDLNQAVLARDTEELQALEVEVQELETKAAQKRARITELKGT